jgi:serine/threonine protein kinase
MGKFQSELHLLCEEARWPEVCSILKLILESETLVAGENDGSDDGGGGDNINANNSEQRPYHLQQSPRSPPGRNGTKKKHSLSSVAPTCATTDHATIYEAASSTDDSYDEGLRCSYEKSKKSQQHHHHHDVPTTLFESSTDGGGEDVATTTTTTTGPVRRSSISSTENNVENLSTPLAPASNNVLSHEQIQSYKQQLISREGPNQWTPLMIACVRAPPMVLSLIARVCPQACSIPDRSGSLPLHFVSCWRRERAKRVFFYKGKDLHSSETSRESSSREHLQQKKQSMEDELCLVFYILMTAYPDSVATINRWNQTPLHSLFESKPTPITMQEYSTEGDSMRNRLCSVEFLLGLWDERMCDKFNSYSFVQEPDAFGNTIQSLQSAVQRALRTRDSKGRLPLHAAAGSQWVDESMLRAVVAAYLPATWIPVIPPNHAQGRGSTATRSSASWDITRNAVIPEDVINQNEETGTDGLFPKTGGCYGKDLAVHMLHRRLMLPLSATENVAGSSFIDASHDDDLHSKSTCLSDASVYFNGNHCGAISALLEPMANAASDDFEAKLACAATGSGINAEEADDGPFSPLHSSYGARNCALLPLHIAAIHGVSYDILEGLLRAHPDGACTPMASLDSDRRRCDVLPIELFEEGRSGREVNVASDTTFPSLMQNYFRRSDLLFSYFPEAVSTKNVAYCKDETRLLRFEKLIRREASRPGEKDLFSDEAGFLWLFLCRNSGPRKSRLPNSSAMIGRILDGLDSASVRKLSILRTKSSPEGVRVPTLPNGRTVIEEAKERAPSGSLFRIMDEHFFHSAMLSYLAPEDAISYSISCRKAQAGGVRLLQETFDEHGSMTWDLAPLFGDETDSELRERGLRVSQPWKQLSLPYVPSSTHSVLVSFEVDYHCPKDNVDEEDGGGGLLILCDDPATNTQGLLVAASIPVPAFDSVAAQVSFSHVPGRNYTLWNYGSEGYTLEISNLTTRQLVYSVDYNGHNPIHVLLSEGDNPPNLKNQITVLTNAGFGSSKKLKATGNLPIFYALKVGASRRTLQLLIDAQPAALLDTNNEKMTPLHAALNCSRMPSIGLVEALLTHSGTNACHLKDSSGRLPLHIAAENGASESLLRVLVDAYPDGCYRRTDAGDLPLHLLVRSGAANQSSVELLLRPIMESNTICTYGGNKELGLNLPLHIAAAYNCSFDILQNVLSSYSAAASIRRQILKSESKIEEKHNSTPEFALAILEEARGKSKSGGAMAKDKALKEADFNRRSDLIFAYFANAPKTELPYLPTYYRDEKDRMERLKTLIRKEAVSCTAMVGTEDNTSSISDMARLAWCWMCTSNDYAGLVAEVLKGLPIDVVHFLISLENPNSEPTPNIPIKECSAPKCAVVMKSRVSFLGRYTFDPMEPPLHKTETSIVLKAKDIGAMEKYLQIQTILSDSDPDIDDYSHSCGSVYGIKKSAIEVNTFTRFCGKLGLDKSRSMEEAEALLRDFYEKDDISIMSQDEGGEINLNRIGVKKIVFDEFCKLHGIDGTGCRVVAVKFMKSRKGFELELQCREILRGNGNIVPVLNEFSLENDNEDNSPPMIAGYRHGIVMPCADRDLGDILYREGISSANLRCNARQIGETLKSLHEQGISYLDLQLKNVLRFGKQLLLSDFGSTLFLKSILDINAIGGSSTTICPSILPPELVAKIDLSTDGYKFDQFRDYWKHVSDDADGIQLLTPHERQLISQIIASHKRGEHSNGHSWRDEISSSLETIDFRDLPRVLSSCDSIHKFSSIWERMCANHRLWDIVRPRVDMTNRCAYMLKTFEDRDDSHNHFLVSKLPYALMRPSVKVDIWVFGIFIYQLCSGGNPFHTGYQGDLRGVDAYSRLHHWSKLEADRSIREHIQDPLAQDLLRQILVPASERLPNMMSVLRHPFFSPTSAEAERYLEKVSI